MNGNNSQQNPYQKLGSKLKAARELRKESLAEVSGAVEIDSSALEGYERGEQRPSEDVLMLLVSYFDINEAEAGRLWDLAGYADPHADTTQNIMDMPQIAMLMPMDARIVYTDRVHVMVNNYGVVMNFMQTSPASSQPLAVARVGMSREHAQSVLEVLQKTLAQNEQNQVTKHLTAPKKSIDKKTDN